MDSSQRQIQPASARRFEPWLNLAAARVRHIAGTTWSAKPCYAELPNEKVSIEMTACNRRAHSQNGFAKYFGRFVCLPVFSYAQVCPAYFAFSASIKMSARNQYALPHASIISSVAASPNTSFIAGNSALATKG